MKYFIISREDEYSLSIEKRLKSQIKHDYDEYNPEIVIAIGGDGTIIKASHQYPFATIFGLHTGHLGFYANYNVEELDVLIDDINNYTYKEETMDMLSFTAIDKEGTIINDNALNEVTIVCPLRTLILDVYIDGIYFEKFRGTGLCVSTPSGSTAYNKSLHGSVIDPNLKVMQLTEIAGINSSSYRTLSSPLVLGLDRKIELKADQASEIFITVDHISYSIKEFVRMEIVYNNKKVKMAYHNHEHFLNRIHRTFLINKK